MRDDQDFNSWDMTFSNLEEAISFSVSIENMNILINHVRKHVVKNGVNVLS